MLKTLALFLALASSVAAENSIIAGYLARSDATAHLEIDLIQKELEDLIGSETCTDFDKLEDFYNGITGTNKGAYFSTIPTYGLGAGENLAVVTKEYTKYYNKDDFHDEWVRKAIANKSTKFKKGNADFNAAFSTAIPGDCVGSEEVVKKGLSYTSTLYEAFQLAQKAIDLVVDGCIQQADASCTDAVEAWDSSVAIYVGSLEGEDGTNVLDSKGKGSYGKAPYALADKRCANYKNCGPNHDLDTKDETSPINMQILALYAAGSQAAYNGNSGLMKYYLRLISNKAAVPLIQGTFRYYWRLSQGSVSDKEVGEGGAFAFGALPKLWACSTKAEKRAFPEMKIGGGIAGSSTGPGVNIDIIRLAFQCNYRCLGITCKDVGALYDGDATPRIPACDDDDNGSINVCDKPKKNVRTACKDFIKKPGIGGRDKLKFSLAESL